MSTASMIRDWTYVAVVALLLASYGYSLLAKGFTAHAAENNGVRVCVLSDASAVKTN